MSIEKNIEKLKKPAAPLPTLLDVLTAPVDHQREIDKLIDDQLDDLLSGDSIPTDWKSKRFFIHLTSGEGGEMAYCVVDGARLTAYQYRILFAIQMDVEITYANMNKVLERYVSSWFFEPDHVQRLKTSFAHEKCITWDDETAGCLFPCHADLPDASGVYAVVDGFF